MKQANLYKNNIARPLNPAVTVTDNSASTVKVEIEEYVFTDEILNGLYRVLDAVRKRTVSHTGIWINGYYGSGKSHFLKYLNFCLSPAHRDVALKRVMEAVKDHYHPEDPNCSLEPSVSEFNDLIQWLGKAEIDTILFNIGDKVGEKTDNHTTIAKAIWEEFNAFRGFNKFSISLAQYLEKPLQERGKFEAFKAALAEDGFNWAKDADTLAVTDLDYVLGKAAEVATLSTDVIREKIATNALDATPEKLSLELKSYVASKGDNYRLLFFIDEVSQFIGSRQELILQFQQIVTTIAQDCDKKVWVGCTSQQDLSEVLDTCHITDASDQYGKILGRFQTRVALQGANTEYITQKRILDKDEDAIIELGKLYDKEKNALDMQFTLPTGFRKFSDKQDFVNYYPFVPYQFQLIMNVFDAFVSLQYVDKEVKGNERSVLKITHKTAQDHSEDSVGGFISFDMMYSSMFAAGLKHAGQRARKNADDIIETYSDKVFGKRVVNLLFMLCNISETNKLLFPATLENIVTLMMTKVDQGRLDLQERISKVLEYLVQKSIIRTETKENGTEVYCFLSEEESQVNSKIMEQSVNNNAMAEALKTIITKYITVSNKEFFNGNPFSIGVSIMDRFIIGQSNSNLLVEFKTDSGYPTPEQFAFNNEPKKMVYYLVDAFSSDKKLKNDFHWYCKVSEYLKNNASNATPQRSKINAEFRQRAADLLVSSIQPGFNKILDSCSIISGHQVIQPALLGSKKATERYKAALTEHFNGFYPQASLVKSSETPVTIDAFKQKIKRAIGQDEYGPLNPMTEAEKEIEIHLNQKLGDPTVADICTHFSQSPYGWNEIATVYFLNELVRRHMRAYSFKGNPNVDKSVVAETILKEKGSYTITTAQKIDPQLVNEFIKAWKEIFNEFGKTYSLDSSELFSECHNDSGSPLNANPVNLTKLSGDLRSAHADGLATIVDDAIRRLNKWKEERDPEKFFRLVIAEKEEGKEMMDNCKEMTSFRDSQLHLFKDFYAFAESNHDNFDFIKDEADRKLVDELIEIFTDQRPDQNLPKYKKRRDILRGKLDEIRKKLVQSVVDSYDAAFAELEEFAQGVGETFDRSPFKNMVNAKTTTNNFYALQNNADVDAFKLQQITVILDQASKKKPHIPTPTDPNPIPPRTIRRAYIHSRQLCKAQTIRNMSELDSYVDSIRQTLINSLGNNDEIIVS